MEVTYTELLKRMPKDHLSQSWIKWFRENNRNNGTFLWEDKNFILVKNYKFVNKELDPKYAWEYSDHLVLFPVRGVTLEMELSPYELEDKAGIVSRLINRGYYQYENAPQHKTIKRWHIQFLKFKK